MNDGRYSTFIDMKKMKENGLICDEKALIHQRQNHQREDGIWRI